MLGGSTSDESGHAASLYAGDGTHAALTPRFPEDHTGVTDAEAVVFVHLLARRTAALAAHGMSIRTSGVRDAVLRSKLQAECAARGSRLCPTAMTAQATTEGRQSIGSWAAKDSMPDALADCNRGLLANAAEELAAKAAAAPRPGVAREEGEQSDSQRGLEAGASDGWDEIDYAQPTVHPHACALLQDNLNFVLQSATKATFFATQGSVGASLRIAGHLVARDWEYPDSGPSVLAFDELTSALQLLSLQVSSFWPCLKLSHLDAKGMQRLNAMIATSAGIDFRHCDHGSRETLIGSVMHLMDTLKDRWALLHRLAASDNSSVSKWAAQEAQCARKGVLALSRTLYDWGAILSSELEALERAAAPALNLIALQNQGSTTSRLKVCKGVLSGLMHSITARLELVFSGAAEQAGPTHTRCAELAVASGLVTAVLPVHRSDWGWWQDLAFADPATRKHAASVAPSVVPALEAACSALQALSRAELHRVPALSSCAAVLQKARCTLATIATGAADAIVALAPLAQDGRRRVRESYRRVAAATGAVAAIVHASVSGLQPESLLSGLRCFGLDPAYPQRTLAHYCCASFQSAALYTFLDQLSHRVPARLLDLDAPTPPHAPPSTTAPQRWNMRCVLIIGSLCELGLGQISYSAAHWSAMMACTRAPEVRSRITLWDDADHNGAHSATAAGAAAAAAAPSDVHSWSRRLLYMLLAGLRQEEQGVCVMLLADAVLEQAALPQVGACNALAAMPLDSVVQKLLVKRQGVVARGVSLAAATVNALVVTLVRADMPDTSQVPTHMLAERVRALCQLWTAHAAAAVSALLAEYSQTLDSLALGRASAGAGAAGTWSFDRHTRARSLLRASAFACISTHCPPVTLTTLFHILAGSFTPDDVPCLLPSSLPRPVPINQPLTDLIPAPNASHLSWPVVLASELIAATCKQLTCVPEAMARARAVQALGPSASSQLPRCGAGKDFTDVAMQELASGLAAPLDPDAARAWTRAPAAAPAAACPPLTIQALAHCLQRSVSAPPNGDSATVANVFAVLLQLCTTAHLAGGVGALVALRLALRPFLQIGTSTRSPSTSHGALLVQLAFVRLTCAALASGAALPPPQRPGEAHAAPPGPADTEASVVWYATQQSLLCCLSALQALLALPRPLEHYVTEQLRNEHAVIGAQQPGACFFWVKQLLGTFEVQAAAPSSVLSGAAAAAATKSRSSSSHTENADSGPDSTVTAEVYMLQYALAASLLLPECQKGLMWVLLDRGPEGLDWAQTAAGRLSWLVGGAHTWFTQRPPAALNALAKGRKEQTLWTEKRIQLLLSQVDDLVETMSSLYGVEVPAHAAAKTIPPSVLTEAEHWVCQAPAVLPAIAAPRIVRPPPQQPMQPLNRPLVPPPAPVQYAVSQNIRGAHAAAYAPLAMHAPEASQATSECVGSCNNTASTRQVPAPSQTRSLHDSGAQRRGALVPAATPSNSRTIPVSQISRGESSFPAHQSRMAPTLAGGRHMPSQRTQPVTNVHPSKVHKKLASASRTGLHRDVAKAARSGQLQVFGQAAVQRVRSSSKRKEHSGSAGPTCSDPESCRNSGAPPLKRIAAPPRHEHTASEGAEQNSQAQPRYGT